MTPLAAPPPPSFWGETDASSLQTGITKISACEQTIILFQHVFTMFRAKSKKLYVCSIWQSTRCAFLIVAWLYLRYIFFVKWFSGFLALLCTFFCNFCVFPVMTILHTGLFFVVYFCSYQAFYLRVSSFVLHWTCAIQVFKLFYILKFI